MKKEIIDIIVFTEKGNKILKIPFYVFNKCSFNKNGTIKGVDYVDQYLREIFYIWCEDWDFIDNKEDKKSVNTFGNLPRFTNNSKTFP